VAPVNDPFTCPNMWLAKSVPVVTAQSTGMNGLAERGLQAWIARAISSLPVPLGPMIRTLEWWAATSSIDRRTCSDHADTPTIRSIAVSARMFPASAAMADRG
jgi:hypothetical protein